MAMRNPGTLRHRITFYRQPQGEDDRGQPDGPETILRSGVLCEVVTLSGREMELARQACAVATHRVGCYADPQRPITQGCFGLWGARRLNIEEVIDPANDGLFVELLCTEEVV